MENPNQVIASRPLNIQNSVGVAPDVAGTEDVPEFIRQRIRKLTSGDTVELGRSAKERARQLDSVFYYKSKAVPHPTLKGYSYHW